MGKIICLMGKSSTGKDTIFKRLLKREELGLKLIVPYTTRPMREGEREGVEYHFTDEAGFQKLRHEGKIIEDRAYDTVHGLWRYFTVADESIDLEQNNYCLIGTLEAYIHIRDYFGEDKVLPVLIELDDGERLQRALNREKKQEQPKYEEMCRRFLADSKDFSEERIAQAGIQKRFYNGYLEPCLRAIITYIRESIEPGRNC
ncbi:MAG: guanylate kinase [Lachnospiraceae bacterium]|nr:guanylate kinase [Lachnospiraceae bacterium]